MEVLIIPVSLIIMALIGTLVNAGWEEIECYLNGDGPPVYQLSEVIYPKSFRETERWPMCPGTGCPHQTIGGADGILWTGEYCFRYLPAKKGVKYV